MTKPNTTYQFQKLSKAEEQKLMYICDRLASAKAQRDTTWDEFDGMDLRMLVEMNAKTANSFIPPRKNSTDVSIVTGTPREKLLSVISNIVKMNLEVDFLAWDKHDNEDLDVARAFTDMVKKSKELEGDAIKKILRWMSLLEQGTIFVEEAYNPYTQKRKKPKDGKAFDPRKGAQAVEYVEELFTNYQCESNIIDMLGVYLGDMRQFELMKQPYLFTRQVVSYEQAKAMFGEWDAWKYVKPGNKSYSEDDSVPYRDYRVEDLESDQVEIIKYQDWWNDEYQIMINGVMMLPVDFWLPWEFEQEGISNTKAPNLTKIVFEPISAFFPYGKSMMQKVRVDGEILDEMLRMLIHKTRQSIKPPTTNRTGKVLSPRIYDPGSMWEAIDGSKLTKLIDHNGVSQSEFAMYQEIKNNISAKTVSPTFQGQQSQTGTTATEILEMQRQARVSLGLTLFSIQWLEERVGWLRLQNILQNWLQPIDFEVDEVRKTIVNKFRTFNVDNVQVNGRNGSHRIELTDGAPNHQQRLDYSFKLRDEEVKKGNKKTTIISLPIMNMLKYRFQARCNAQERPSDNVNKVLFQEEMNQALTFFGPSVNQDFYKKKFAQIWGNDPDEMFTQQNMQALDQVMQAANQGQAPQGPQSPIPPTARPDQRQRTAINAANNS